MDKSIVPNTCDVKTSLRDSVLLNILTGMAEGDALNILTTFFSKMDTQECRAYLSKIAKSLEEKEAKLAIVNNVINRKKDNLKTVSIASDSNNFVVTGPISAGYFAYNRGLDYNISSYYHVGRLTLFPSLTSINEFLISFDKFKTYEIFPIDLRNFWVRKEEKRAYNQPVSLSFSKWKQTEIEYLECCLSTPRCKTRHNKAASNDTNQLWENVQILEFRISVPDSQIINDDSLGKKRRKISNRLSPYILCISLYTNMGKKSQPMAAGPVLDTSNRYIN